LVVCMFLWDGDVLPEKLSGGFCHALAYLPWKYE